MATRVQLHKFLEDLIGSKNVYFQPPESKKISYPCVIYSRDGIKMTFANNKPYDSRIRYKVMFISQDPDDVSLDKFSSLPMCTFVSHYTSDNLNHDIYNLYY